MSDELIERAREPAEDVPFGTLKARGLVRVLRELADALEASQRQAYDLGLWREQL